MSDPIAADAPPDFAAFEASENAKATGQPELTPVPAPAVADPEADEHDEPAAVVADPVAATPTPEKPVSKRQQHINDLERKAKTAEIRAEQLAERLAALEAKAAPVKEPEKAAPVAVVDPNDPEPEEAKFEDYKSFVKAQAKWEIRQAKREADAEATAAKAKDAETAAERAFIEKATAWVERRDAFAAKNPAFTEKAMPFLDRVFSGTPIGDTLTDSPVGPQLALYLAEHPDVLERIQSAHPILALRELGKLEAKFDDSLTSASASAGPAAKTVTTAPAPPMTLAARSADPADPVAAAIERGDFRAFEAEENRRALTASR